MEPKLEGFKHLVKALSILTIQFIFSVANKDKIIVVIGRNMVH